MAIRQVTAVFVFAAMVSFAQPPQGPPPPGGGERKGRPGGGFFANMPSELAVADREGFESIFDGSTLKGWEGDTAFWRAENGVIIGETTKENPLKQNTFLIWRGGSPADFELKVDYRMNSTNSGVQYRSVELPEVGKFVLKGYQADIDFTNTFTGQLYEERGRGFLALRGQATEIPEGKKARIIGNIKNGDDAKGIIKINDWNTLHIIAQGNTLIHILNGQVTSLVLDDDTKARALSGLIGFQIHVGQPMKVEFRNIAFKKR